jgi:predicted ArsR family transcriptional regulator
MNRAAADTIGRTLARLGQIASRPNADADTSRDHILRLIQESQEPLGVEEISSLTNLHANTIRTHLEVLRAAGHIERTRSNPGGRGRPKWLYSPVVSHDPYRQLAADLAAALTGADEDTAGAAAERWRAADHIAHQSAESPDDAVAVAANALERLGFDVEVSPVGDAVYLGNCPYAGLVAGNPAICDIHARAVEQVLAGTGQDVQLASMDVFPRPGVCVAHLKRGDRRPHRVVKGEVQQSRRSS